MSTVKLLMCGSGRAAAEPQTVPGADNCQAFAIKLENHFRIHQEQAASPLIRGRANKSRKRSPVAVSDARRRSRPTEHSRCRQLKGKKWLHLRIRSVLRVEHVQSFTTWACATSRERLVTGSVDRPSERFVGTGARQNLPRGDIATPSSRRLWFVRRSSGGASGGEGRPGLGVKEMRRRPANCREVLQAPGRSSHVHF